MVAMRNVNVYNCKGAKSPQNCKKTAKTAKKCRQKGGPQKKKVQQIILLIFLLTFHLKMNFSSKEDKLLKMKLGTKWACGEWSAYETSVQSGLD